MIQAIIIVGMGGGSRWIHINMGFKSRWTQQVIHPIQPARKLAQRIDDQDLTLKNGAS